MYIHQTIVKWESASMLSGGATKLLYRFSVFVHIWEASRWAGAQLWGVVTGRVQSGRSIILMHPTIDWTVRPAGRLMFA